MAVGVTVTVAGAVAVSVTPGVTVTVYVGIGVGVSVGDVVGVNVTVGDGLGPWVPDRVVACAAVPVSAIAATPMARQPDARLVRIAISRSCSPDRFVTVIMSPSFSPPPTGYNGARKQGARFGHTKIQGKSLLVRGLNAPAAVVRTPLSAATPPPRAARPAWPCQESGTDSTPEARAPAA